MAGVRIKWMPGAFKKIRHAYGPYVAELAQKAAADLPEGYAVIVQNDPSTQRPRAYIAAISWEARKDDAEHSTLLKKVSALRGT